MSSVLDDINSDSAYTSYQNLLPFRYTVELQSVLLTKNKMSSIWKYL